MVKALANQGGLVL